MTFFSIRQWCSVLDGSPGFTKQVFDFLKEKSDKRQDPLVVSLIVDEMSIMLLLLWIIAVKF